MNVTAMDLNKSYGKKNILSNISFSIKTGSVLAIAGANGAGKTTLLKILAMVSSTDNGKYYLNGRSVAAQKHLRERIAYVPQQVSAFMEMTVYDNLRYWLKRGNERTFQETIENLGLTNYLDTRAEKLSGGYLRRLNLATALINAPDLLIMDEPLTGVDIDTRLSFGNWIKALSAKGVTVIYTTHHSDEITGIAHCLGIIYKGGLKFIPEIDGLFLDNLISRFIKLND